MRGLGGLVAVPETLCGRDEVADTLFLQRRSESAASREQRRGRPHEFLHLGEASLDLAVPNELPACPLFLPLSSFVPLTGIAQKPDSEAPARLGSVSRNKSNGAQAGRRVGGRWKGQEELSLRPRRPVEPLRTQRFQ